MIWKIIINSKENLSDNNRDFIAELVSEEARKTVKFYNFILHEIIESNRYSKIFIEGNKFTLANLLSVIKDNLPYKFYYARIKN